MPVEMGLVEQQYEAVSEVPRGGAPQLDSTIVAAFVTVIDADVEFFLAAAASHPRP